MRGGGPIRPGSCVIKKNPKEQSGVEQVTYNSYTLPNTASLNISSEILPQQSSATAASHASEARLAARKIRELMLDS